MAGFYTVTELTILAETFDWAGADIRVTLLGPSYTFSAAHASLADVVAHEVSSSYRRTLDGRSTPVDNAGVREYPATSPTWIAPAGAARYVFIYIHHASTSSATAIACYDLGSTVTFDGRDWTAVFTGGIAIVQDYVADSATRADSASVPGGPFTTRNGTVGISSNKFYAPAGNTDNAATADCGSPDGSVKITLSAFSTGDYLGLTLRTVDYNNRYQLNTTRTAGSIDLYRIVGGVAGLPLANATGISWTDGDVLRVIMLGATFRCYRNATLLFGGPVTDGSPVHTSETRHGFRVDLAATEDDFRFDARPELGAVTSTFVDAPVIWANLVPEPDAADVTSELIQFDVLAVDSGDPVRSVSLGLERDGVAIPFTYETIAGGYRVTAHPPNYPGRTYSLEASADTVATAGVPSLRTWEYTAKPFGAQCLSRLDAFVIRRLGTSARADGVKRSERGGHTSARCDGALAYTIGSFDQTFGRAQGIVAILMDHCVCAAGFVVGDPVYEPLLAALQLENPEATVETVAASLYAQTTTLADGVLAGLLVALVHDVSAAIAGATVGTPADESTPAGASIDGVGTSGLLIVEALSEDVAADLTPS